MALSKFLMIGFVVFFNSLVFAGEKSSYCESAALKDLESIPASKSIQPFADKMSSVLKHALSSSVSSVCPSLFEKILKLSGELISPPALDFKSVGKLNEDDELYGLKDVRVFPKKVESFKLKISQRINMDVELRWDLMKLIIKFINKFESQAELKPQLEAFANTMQAVVYHDVSAGMRRLAMYIIAAHGNEKLRRVVLNRVTKNDGEIVFSGSYKGSSSVTGEFLRNYTAEGEVLLLNCDYAYRDDISKYKQTNIRKFRLSSTRSYSSQINCFVLPVGLQQNTAFNFDQCKEKIQEITEYNKSLDPNDYWERKKIKNWEEENVCQKFSVVWNADEIYYTWDTYMRAIFQLYDKVEERRDSFEKFMPTIRLAEKNDGKVDLDKLSDAERAALEKEQDENEFIWEELNYFLGYLASRPSQMKKLITAGEFSLVGDYNPTQHEIRLRNQAIAKKLLEVDYSSKPGLMDLITVTDSMRVLKRDHQHIY